MVFHFRTTTEARGCLSDTSLRSCSSWPTDFCLGEKWEMARFLCFDFQGKFSLMIPKQKSVDYEVHGAPSSTEPQHQHERAAAADP